MRTDPFREFDRLSEAVFGTSARPAAMPMDAYRDHNRFVIQLDLPGVDAESIDLTVERNVLTIHAERPESIDSDSERIVAERSYGTFSRQLFLGETLDVDRLSADYEAGVLTIEIPVAEQAKPRKIAIGGTDSRRRLSA
ncbi:MAG: Hsp20/alpha crystallin family protein [Aeromicrobium sp.]